VSAGKPVDRNENPPSFREFHERLWAGDVNLADNVVRVVYALVHWEQLKQNVRRERFDEALGIVAERNHGHEFRLLLPRAPSPHSI
jgi:hypothetical protein